MVLKTTTSDIKFLFCCFVALWEKNLKCKNKKVNVELIPTKTSIFVFESVYYYKCLNIKWWSKNNCWVNHWPIFFFAISVSFIVIVTKSKNFNSYTHMFKMLKCVSFQMFVYSVFLTIINFFFFFVFRNLNIRFFSMK